MRFYIFFAMLLRSYSYPALSNGLLLGNGVGHAISKIVARFNSLSHQPGKEDSDVIDRYSSKPFV